MLTQEQRWGFPSKQNPAHKNPALSARVKELWEKNTTQKDMLHLLQVEGFQINDRELTRLRSRFGWFLRDNRGRREGSEGGDDSRQKERRHKDSATINGPIDHVAAAKLQEAGPSEEEHSGKGIVAGEETHGDAVTNESERVPSAEPVDFEDALRRKLTQIIRQSESDEKLRVRKRRRRTRAWAGLPADAPGEPPRFPSETTLDESKAYLSLDNKLYSQVRDEFQAICRSENILKKTVAGPEKWAELLRRLVRGNRHLKSVFEQLPELLQQTDALWRPKDYKTLSLDVICQDVTKRMRVMDSRMSIPEAKNALGLNPSQTREVKHAFYRILKADHFTNKFEAGGKHWAELKQRWVDGSELLQNAIALNEGEGDAEHAQRLRAMELLARDVMKRLRAENTRTDALSGSSHKAVHQGPGPGPAPPSAPSQKRATRRSADSNNGGSGLTQSNHAHGNGHRHTGPPSITSNTDLQIDPSLLLAASDAILPDTISSAQQQPSVTPLPSAADQDSNPSPPFPVYIRPHPNSTTPTPHKTVWLSILQNPTVEEIRRLALQEHPRSELVRLEGVVQTLAGEACVSIDDDGELEAYLGHVGAERMRGVGTGKVTFVVLLRGVTEG